MQMDCGVKEYLLKKEKYEFLAMTMLCFNGFLRPIEICKLKSEYFNLEKRTIYLPYDITKNKKERIVTLTDELFECLHKINIQTIEKGLYVFSTGWKPGKKLQNTRYIGKVWEIIRRDLNLPPEYQFYSLKDSGIVQKLRDGIPGIEVRNQAGHSSLTMTEKYAKYANPNGSEEIKNKSSKF